VSLAPFFADVRALPIVTVQPPLEVRIPAEGRGRNGAMFQMILINGLVFGGVYATLAVGFSLVFGVAKILNMAHTGFYMITAFLMFVGSAVIGIPLLPSALLSIFTAGIVAIICYKLVFDRVKTHEIALLIISIALAMLFQEILLLIFAAHYRNIPPFVPGYREIAGLRVSYQHLLTIGSTVATLVALWALLTRTRLGDAIRAVAEDSETANLMGINVGRVCMITMGISAVLAGVAAAVVAPLFTVEPHMWVHPLIMILAVVVLGGMGSIKGSVMAAFILGFAETVVVFLVPSGGYLRGAVSLGIMVVVLIVRPEGLFGVVFEEERL